MKKTIFALMAITVLGLASCQKTETPDPEPTASETVEGTYTGTMTVTIPSFIPGGDPAVTELPDQTIDILANGDTAIDLVITDFAFEGLTLGTISLVECPLTENAADGTITTASDQTISVSDIGDCDITMGGTFGESTASLDLQITPAVFPLNVSVHFEGTRAETDTE